MNAPVPRTTPVPWLPLLAGIGALALAALILAPGHGVKRILAHGSPDAPRPAGAPLDFLDMTLAVARADGRDEPLPTRAAEPTLLARFDLALAPAPALPDPLPLTDLSVTVLDGAGASLAARCEAPGLFLGTGETLLVPHSARIPAAWKRYLVHVEYISRDRRRVEAFVELPVVP